MEFPNKRYEGLHIPNLLSIDDEKRLRSVIDCNIFESLFVSKRIGSESQVGTIWLSSLNIDDRKTSFIIKVQSNRKKAHAEFDVQNYLSHKWSKNFVVTYGCIDCPEVTLWNDGVESIINTGNFIFMETGIGDLEQVIKYSIVDENMLTGYILDVIDSVEITSSEKVFHGDLHIRQIFIVMRNVNNCEPIRKAVIGDFGEHLRIDSPTTHLSDLKIFFKSLLEIIHAVENSDEFFYKISKCLDFISHRTSRIELDDLSYNILSLQRDISEIKTFFNK